MRKVHRVNRHTRRYAGGTRTTHVKAYRRNPLDKTAERVLWVAGAVGVLAAGIGVTYALTKPAAASTKTPPSPLPPSPNPNQGPPATPPGPAPQPPMPPQPVPPAPAPAPAAPTWQKDTSGTFIPGQKYRLAHDVPNLLSVPGAKAALEAALNGIGFTYVTVYWPGDTVPSDFPDGGVNPMRWRADVTGGGFATALPANLLGTDVWVLK